MEGVGLIRAMKFAKYLPSYGWEPVVLTVKSSGERRPAPDPLPGIKVVRTGYLDVVAKAKDTLENIKFWNRKSADPGLSLTKREIPALRRNGIASIARELITMPDEQAGWYDFAVDAGKKIVDEEGIDIIFSTSPPETSHCIARSLKRYRAIPWVADLRDLWADDHYRARSLLKRTILRSMEKKVFRDADKVVTVSKPWADKLRSSVQESKITVIENGFDEEDFSKIQYKNNEKFTISYMGKLHKAHQPVDLFFKAISRLIKDGIMSRQKIEIKFYISGHDRPDINSMAREYELNDVIKECETVSYARSSEVQRSSDLLLFVQWTGEGSDGWYSAKLYDYIGARRPILALAKKGGIIEGLINRTSSGVIVQDEAQLRDCLSRFYNEYTKNGSVVYTGLEREIEKNSRIARTAKLAGIFSALVKD